MQIGSFMACTYDEKWWLGMVAQISYEFEDHNINFMHPSGPGKQFHWPTKVDTCWSSNIVCIIEAPVLSFHHHGNTLLVGMTIKKITEALTNSLYNGISWNISK